MPARRLLASLVLTAVVASACTAAGATTAPVAQPTAAPSQAASAQASAPASAPMTIVIGSASASLGTYLTDPAGMTLYTKTGDSSTSSTCTGTCAAAWPPVLVATGGSATAGTGVTGTFATLTRTDGTVQVTYQGLPLYGWNGDTKPGDMTGEGVSGFVVATVGGPVAVPSASSKSSY